MSSINWSAAMTPAIAPTPAPRKKPVSVVCPFIAPTIIPAVTPPTSYQHMLWYHVEPTIFCVTYLAIDDGRKYIDIPKPKIHASRATAVFLNIVDREPAENREKELENHVFIIESITQN